MGLSFSSPVEAEEIAATGSKYSVSSQARLVDDASHI